MIVGLFIPVIIVDLPNTDYARLLFQGPKPSELTSDGITVFPKHASIEGWRIASVTFTKAIGKASKHLEWTVFFLFNIPLLLAFVAPVLLLFKIKEDKYIVSTLLWNEQFHFNYIDGVLYKYGH